MKDLSPEKKAVFEEALSKWRKEIHNGYIRLTKSIVKNKVKQTFHLKRSRVLVQLHINKELEPWEHVHHIDGNKQNDEISNLQILSDAEHISITHAGSRKRKTTKGDFYERKKG